jgi:hypothetical protein
MSLLPELSCRILQLGCRLPQFLEGDRNGLFQPP